MKFGVCMGAVDKEKIELASDSGADFIAANLFCMSELSTEKLAEVIDISRSYGKLITATNGFFGKMTFFENADDYEKSAEYVKRTFEKMASTDIKFMTLGSGRHRNIPEGYSREAAVEKYIKLCRDVIAPEAEAYGYTIGIEPLNTKEVNFITSTSEAVDIINAVGKPQIKLLIDYYHFMLEKEQLTDIAKIGNLVAHLHIASSLNERHIPLPMDGEENLYGKFFKQVKKYVPDDVDLALEGKILDPKVQKLRHSLHYLRRLYDKC